MPILLPTSKKKYYKDTKKTRAVKPSKKIELQMRGVLYASVDQMILDMQEIQEYLANSNNPAEATRIIDALRGKWEKLYRENSAVLARGWVDEIDKSNKIIYEKNIARSMGVDYSHIFDEKLVKDKAEVANFEATYLIKTIPEEFFGDVSKAVMKNFQQIPLPEGRSLLEEIQEIYKVSKARANVIARDQTSKINTAINQARSEEIGVEEYIWRTAGDSRVVGDPSGMYPKGNRVHGNHYSRNGKVFRWNEPPYDGHPGFAINCRCYAEPIIDIKKLKAV